MEVGEERVVAGLDRVEVWEERVEVMEHLPPQIMAHLEEVAASNPDVELEVTGRRGRQCQPSYSLL